ncbi:MAG: methionine gamma-lyase family protein [Eubacterium sp.]|nr:methionine gamma-lyase family protein [Eubacterium sp.]
MNNQITVSDMYEKFGISKEVIALGDQVLGKIQDRFHAIDEVAEINQLKIIHAMQKNRVSESHLWGSTGYGYNDSGRDTLEKVYADIFHCEDALVRSQITCGTHALTIALAGILRPGDELLSPVGKPYDTLEGIIGMEGTKTKGSLREFGISYRQVDLLEDSKFDYEGIKNAINEKTKLVTIQRSKGYALRKTFSVEQIGELISFIKGIKPDVICMVDNCYGELVETIEPTDVGADLCVGSLIKNLGGSLAPLGGYIVGKKDLVELCAYRLTAPGLGKEVGASLNVNASFYQGLFMAPTVVASALKSSIFAANLYEHFGFTASPNGTEPRFDIIQAIAFESPERVIAFCQGIQQASPVDSYVLPEPYAMPGYHSDVIMAAGAFIQGSSIELSADAPIEPPYSAFFQGGVTWQHGKLGILKTLQNMLDLKLVELS